MIVKNDCLISRNRKGAINIRIRMNGGHLFKRTYYFCSESEAVRRFLQEVNGLERSRINKS